MAIMNRQQVKELLPIIQAFAEGKTIQVQEDTDLRYLGDEIDFNFSQQRYRIKPDTKYRPFKDADECWQEMQKHKPFGWIKKISGHCHFLYIMELYFTGIVFNDVDNFGGIKNLLKTYNFAFTETTFADGTPFGVKVME